MTQLTDFHSRRKLRHLSGIHSSDAEGRRPPGLFCAVRLPVAVTLECQLCYRELDPAQALRFLVETENLTSPAYLDHIRHLPSVRGRPLCVCKHCQAKLEARPRVQRKAPTPAGRPQFRSAVLTMIGFFAFGWVFTAVV